MARQTVWMPAGTVSNGLPIELADARPSGFLGRHLGAIHADLRLPARLADWSDHHVLTAMSRRGEDLPGNLIVGDESFARWQALEIVVKTRNDYPELAEATIAGHPPGSSADNIVFFAEGSGLRLAPAFDQVSMLYAPSADGQVPSRIFALPHATADTLDVWDDARMAAREFWHRASDDGRLSDEIRCACAANANALAS